MSELGPPPNPDLPFFAYGLLKPKELGFPQLHDYVSSSRPATAIGTLKIRDGIPLYVKTPGVCVKGYIIEFKPWLASDAWAAIREFEPGAQYKWLETEVTDSNGVVRVNILEGRKPDIGTGGDSESEWSVRLDPVFKEGLEVVGRLMKQAAPRGIQPQPESEQLWESFFELQAAYLLLWSAVERYTCLKYGPQVGPTERVTRLDRDNDFLLAMKKIEATGGKVVDTRDPGKSVDFATNPAEYFYQIRSNISHRGKGASRDAGMLFHATDQLLGILKALLSHLGSLPSD